MFSRRVLRLCYSGIKDNPGWTREYALGQVFEEFNSFGLAAQSHIYRLSEREMFGIKACWGSCQSMFDGFWVPAGSAIWDVQRSARFDVAALAVVRLVELGPLFFNYFP